MTTEFAPQRRLPGQLPGIAWQDDGPSGRIIRTIERANQRVRRYLAAQLDDLDITEIEAHLLARLEARGPCSVAEVQHAFGLRRSTLTNALDRLEHKGLLTRQLHPSDRRTFLLELTASGREAASRVTGVVDHLEEHVRARVSEVQVETFFDVVAVLEELPNDFVKPWE